MTKSRARFSAVAALAIFTLMGFGPGALAQGAVSGTLESANVALSHVSAGLLVLAPAPGREHPCDNKDDGRGKRGGCTAVPEGGATFLYLLVVGLCCVATAIFTMRRQAQARQTE